MECHYCDDEAEIVVEKDNLKVGICEDDFRTQLDELADSEWLQDIEEYLEFDPQE